VGDTLPPLPPVPTPPEAGVPSEDPAAESRDADPTRELSEAADEIEDDDDDDDDEIGEDDGDLDDDETPAADVNE
jgi:hypothetical protein